MVVSAGEALETDAALSADIAWALGVGGVEASEAGAVDPYAPLVGIIFPMEERITWVDTWGAPRDGGTRSHEGNDLLAPKMTPLLAVVDGEVDWLDPDGSSRYNLLLRGDDGNDYFYIHINNDTPGTDDGKGGVQYAYAPGLYEGQHVECGELIAYVGDSGNAESTVPHLHFEIHHGGYKNPIDPYNSLMAAPTLAEWIAAGKPDLDPGAHEPVAPCTSLRGTDRFDTALKISQAMFPGALPAEAGLVLAPGETYQEALCGAPLATAYGGPVLLTPAIGLNNAVRDEIIRLAPKYVFCVGLSDDIVAAVQTALGTGGTASAIRGVDVYDMSYKVALALGQKVGDLSGAVAIVTRGDLFPDAIGVSPLACAQEWPVLLTYGPTDDLHASAAAAMSELGITKALKVGTYARLPDVVNGLANLSGTDRYYTNRNVADWAKSNAGLTFVHLGVTTGDKFPDALASGPYLALDDGILLLSPLNGPLPSCIGVEIVDNSAAVQQVSFIAMVEPVITQVKARLP
jgi:putative cell wall-binding protein